MRKGLCVGSGRKGYYNVMSTDPRVHRQSAMGMKQPQKLPIGAMVTSRFTQAKGQVVSTNPFAVKYSYNNKKAVRLSNPKYWEKGGKFVSNPYKLPTVTYRGKVYIVDFKLGELRNVATAEPIKFTNLGGDAKDRIHSELRGIRSRYWANEYIAGVDDVKGELQKGGKNGDGKNYLVFSKGKGVIVESNVFAANAEEAKSKIVDSESARFAGVKSISDLEAVPATEHNIRVHEHMKDDVGADTYYSIKEAITGSPRYEGGKLNVSLEDDGTLDTVVSVDGQTFRFSTEYAAQFRNKKGEITKSGWKRLKKEAIDAYEMEQDYPSNGGKQRIMPEGRISYNPIGYLKSHGYKIVKKPKDAQYQGVGEEGVFFYSKKTGRTYIQSDDGKYYAKKGGKLPFSKDGIGHADLPIENAVYVPSTDKNQKQIPEKEFRKRIAQTENTLTSMFGGFTRFDDYGGYKGLKGDIIKEKGARVVSFASAKDAKDKQKLANLKEWLLVKQKQWGQESIGYENEGDLHYIWVK